MNDSEDSELKVLLSSFLCRQDPEIERFLKTRSVEFEKCSKARTYLLFSEGEFLSLPLSKITILGYFTVTLKVLTVPADSSNRCCRELDGYRAKQHGEVISSFPCYLTGQLARNSAVPKEYLSGSELLNLAESVVASAIQAVGGRILLIECRPVPALIRFYSENGYRQISSAETEENNPLVKMIRILT